MTEPPSPFDPPTTALESAPGVSSGRTAMDYSDAYRSFFQSPKWGTNLLLLGVCVLIPFVGVIGLQGYLGTIVARRHTHGEVIPPEFDFNRFGTFIGRGIWSFLASLIAAAVIVPLIGVVAGIGVVVAQGGGERATVVAIVAGVLVLFIVSLAMVLVMRPILLRATFSQGLTGVFAFDFVGDFAQRMWVEMLISQLFMFVTMIPLVIAGYAMCGLGVYPAVALMSYATAQLDLQLYEVYLSRGGTVVPINPKLLSLTE